MSELPAVAKAEMWDLSQEAGPGHAVGYAIPAALVCALCVGRPRHAASLSVSALDLWCNG